MDRKEVRGALDQLGLHPIVEALLGQVLDPDPARAPGSALADLERHLVRLELSEFQEVTRDLLKVSRVFSRLGRATYGEELSRIVRRSIRRLGVETDLSRRAAEFATGVGTEVELETMRGRRLFKIGYRSAKETLAETKRDRDVQLQPRTPVCRHRRKKPLH